jgi:hypothetical protein
MGVHAMVCDRMLIGFFAGLCTHEQALGQTNGAQYQYHIEKAILRWLSGRTYQRHQRKASHQATCDEQGVRAPINSTASSSH